MRALSLTNHHLGNHHLGQEQCRAVSTIDLKPSLRPSRLDIALYGVIVGTHVGMRDSRDHLALADPTLADNSQARSSTCAAAGDSAPVVFVALRRLLSEVLWLVLPLGMPRHSFFDTM